MNTERAEALLNRISDVLGEDGDHLRLIPRIQELASKALADPTALTPVQIQELAKAMLIYIGRETIARHLPSQTKLSLVNENGLD